MTIHALETSIMPEISFQQKKSARQKVKKGGRATRAEGGLE